MNRYNCIIIDDEPYARSLIATHIEEFRDFAITQEFKSAIEARTFLEDNKVDVVFLDINMPKLSGIDFIKNINSDALIIFTTAYPEFAVDAFEHNAFDYLVKPISFNRFLKSIEKIKDHLQSDKTQKNDSMTIKENKRLYKVSLNDISHIEAYGDYVKIHTSARTYTTKSKLSNYENLNLNFFIRIHRSFIINIDKVDYMEGNFTSIADKKIPISSSYRDGFIAKYHG